MTATKVYLGITLIGITTALTVCAGPARAANKPKEVDFGLANPILQAIAKQVIAGDEQVEFAYPEFDTQLSSLENERLVYSIEGKIKNARWKNFGDSDGRASVEGRADFKADRLAIIPGIDIQAEGIVATDTLSLIRFAAQTGLDRGDYQDGFQQETRDILKKGLLIQSLSDFYNVLKASQDLSVKVLRTRIKEKMDEADCIIKMECGTPHVDQWGNRTPDMERYNYAEKRMLEFHLLLSSYETVEFTLNKSGTVLKAVSKSPRGFAAETLDNRHTGEVKRAELTITPKTVTAKVDVFAQVQLRDLDETHADLNKHLNGIINNEQSSFDKVQTAYRNVLKGFKKAINGEVF